MGPSEKNAPTTNDRPETTKRNATNFRGSFHQGHTSRYAPKWYRRRFSSKHGIQNAPAAWLRDLCMSCGLIHRTSSRRAYSTAKQYSEALRDPAHRTHLEVAYLPGNIHGTSRTEHDHSGYHPCNTGVGERPHSTRNSRDPGFFGQPTVSFDGRLLLPTNLAPVRFRGGPASNYGERAASVWHARRREAQAIGVSKRTADGRFLRWIDLRSPPWRPKPLLDGSFRP